MHLNELLSRQDVSNMLDNLKETNKAVVEEVVPGMLSMGAVHRVLQNLLREGVSIKNLGLIMEVLSDYGSKTKDTAILSELVRQELGRSIVAQYLDENNQLKVITFNPELEKMISDCVTANERGTHIAMDPAFMQVIVNNTAQKVDEVILKGDNPVLICSPAIRLHLKRIIESKLPTVPVLSYAEVDPKIAIKPMAVVGLNHDKTKNIVNA